MIGKILLLADFMADNLQFKLKYRYFGGGFMSNQLKADLMLVLVTLGWGASFYLMDLSLEDMGPFTLNAFRFLLAFLIVVVFSFKKLKGVNKTTIKYALVAGVMMAVAYIMATYGVMYTTLSNTAFLASTTVLFTPIFAYFFKGQKPSGQFKLVVVLCLIGMAMLTLNEELKPAIGDVYSIICAVAFSINLLVVETAVSKQEVDAYTLGVAMLGVVGVIMFVMALIFETPHLPSTSTYWFSSLFLSLFCTGLAVIAQALAQQYTTASHVGLIYTLEPIFAAVVAFFLAGEVLKPRGYFGAALMIASVFIMEIDFKKKFDRSKRLKERFPDKHKS